MPHERPAGLIIACLISLAAVQPAWSQSAGDSLPRRGYFGVALAEADESGVRVTEVAESSTAKAMGVEPNDVILTVDGNVTNTPAEVQAAIGSHQSGDRVRIELSRDGEPIDLDATLQALPHEAMQSSSVEYGSVTTDQGVRLRTITSVPLNGSERSPAVFLIQGGGCGSIDAPWTTMQIGQVGLIHSIATGGFVTMRVDKSGVGDSEGAPCSAIGYYEELAGYQAGLRALQAHPSVDPDRIFLLGISLGGVFAPIVANGTDVAGITVYSTLARPPYPYPGRSARFFEEFKDIDVHSAWEAVDVPVQLIRGQYDELRAEMQFLARLLGESNPGATEYLELDRLDHCWTRHETFEDSIDNCGGGVVNSDLSDAVLEFLNAHS